MKDNVKRLFEVLQRFDKELNEIGSAIRDLSTSLLLMNIASPSFFDAQLTRIENQIRHRLRMATHALQTAQHRRLAIDYLSPKQIRTLFSKLQQRAGEFGCKLLIQHHSDLFQIEVSLLFDGRDAHLWYMSPWYQLIHSSGSSNFTPFLYLSSRTTSSYLMSNMTFGCSIIIYQVLKVM